MTHQHEKDTGRTSSITNVYIDDTRVYDLCGHEKYIRITLNGLLSHQLDYILLIISNLTPPY